jgi:predicted RNase H-like nuclease (RuvC/YqgF family)
MRGKNVSREKLKLDPQIKLLTKQNKLLAKQNKQQDRIIQELFNRVKQLESNNFDSVKPIPKPRNKQININDLPPPPSDFFDNNEESVVYIIQQKK